MTVDVDVLCVGHASYDLIFSVSRHPGADEKSPPTACLVAAEDLPRMPPFALASWV